MVDVHTRSSNSNNYEAMVCMEILGNLRRCFTQQAEVRLILYEVQAPDVFLLVWGSWTFFSHIRMLYLILCIRCMHIFYCVTAGDFTLCEVRPLNQPFLIHISFHMSCMHITYHIMHATWAASMQLIIMLCPIWGLCSISYEVHVKFM